MYMGIHGKYLLFLSDFNETSFLYQFLRNTQISDFMKMHPVTAKLFHADRWTDEQTDKHDKANRCCLEFCEHT